MCKFVRFSVVCNLVWIYSPDGANMYGSRDGQFKVIESAYVVESCKIVFLGGGHFVFTCPNTFAVGCIV